MTNADAINILRGQEKAYWDMLSQAEHKAYDMAVDALELLKEREAQGWISVNDRLPERGVVVLTVVYGIDIISQEEGETLSDAINRSMRTPGRVEVGFLDEDGFWCDYAFGGPMVIGPTYWMPLPEPPKEET